MLYTDGDSGLRRYDSKSGVDTLLVRMSGGGAAWVSPDSTKLAVSCTLEDTTCLNVVEVASGQTWRIVWDPFDDGITYTVDWAASSKELAVGCAPLWEFTHDQIDTTGDLLIASYDGRWVRSVGCRVSRIVKSWLEDGTLLVEGPENLYVVDTATCKTLYRKSRDKINWVTVSADRKILWYYKTFPVYDRDQGVTHDGHDLHVSGIRGDHDKTAIGYFTDSRGAVWSPDGAAIACDVASPRYADIRHIAIYDLLRDSLFYYSEDTPEGNTYISHGPVWSPNGQRIAYQRSLVTYVRNIENACYVESEVVSRDVSRTGFETVTPWIRIIRSSGPQLTHANSSAELRTAATSAGRALGWVDNEHILIFTSSFVGLYDLKGDLILQFPWNYNIVFFQWL